MNAIKLKVVQQHERYLLLFLYIKDAPFHAVAGPATEQWVFKIGNIYHHTSIFNIYSQWMQIS